ncbi:hypothetical protein HY404_00195 [Candidatus Microgenomates bacterium]|nr:hypothetical protein [Candidatus Microgenomates bacterium]
MDREPLIDRESYASAHAEELSFEVRQAQLRQERAKNRGKTDEQLEKEADEFLKAHGSAHLTKKI